MLKNLNQSQKVGGTCPPPNYAHAEQSLGTIFFIFVSDLYDWSKNSEKCRMTNGTVNVRRLRRQSSATGSLVEVNEKKVALFRYGENVYAIDEKCPHAGKKLIQSYIRN